MWKKEKDFGFELIKELKRRKLWGSFLTYKQYYELKHLHGADEVHYFLLGAGYKIPYSDNVSTIVSSLEKTQYQKDRNIGTFFIFIDSFLQLIQWIFLCVFH